MKLRLRGNSLRLRLTQGEVSALAEKGRVEEELVFGAGARLVYSLEGRAEVAAISAELEGANIRVVLPVAVARAWATSDEVGIEAVQSVDGDGELRILVEKDFACLKPRAGENDDDAFPNPNTSC